MGRDIRYTEEFDQETVSKVVVHGLAVMEVSHRLRVTNSSLHDWIMKHDNSKATRTEENL